MEPRRSRAFASPFDAASKNSIACRTHISGSAAATW